MRAHLTAVRVLSFVPRHNPGKHATADRPTNEHPKMRHFEQSAGDLYKKIRRENRLTHDPVAMTDHLSSLPNCSKFRAKASFAYTNAPKKSNLRCLLADLVVSAIFLHFATQVPTVRVPVNA